MPPPPPPVGKFTTIRIFYATDRKTADTSQPAFFYGPARRVAEGGAPTYEVGQCDVSIPFDHEVGELESPVWWKAEFRPDPERHIVLLSVVPEDSARYFSEMRQRVAGSPSKDAFVFIHGYNTTFEDAARRTAQMAYDLRFQGAPILYSWPSQGEIAKYTFDENNVEWTWRHLADFLQALSQQSGAITIHLIAHSMGNRALTNALQRMPKGTTPLFREVILAAPDIDADLFKQMAVDMQGKASRITLYASSKDDALKASKAAHGELRAGDSDNMVIVEGVDSIDASAAATDFLGHGYVFKSSILFDINNLFKLGKPPQERDKLRQEHLGSFLYWLLTP
jgi:esterase/lipase superfamily enzyme